MNSAAIEQLARENVAAMLAAKRIPNYFAGLATELMVVAFIRGASCAIEASSVIIKPLCTPQA